MGVTKTDDFTRANGAVGSMPDGPVYEALSGSAAIASNRLQFSTAPGSNPILAVETGKRLHGSCDVEVSMTYQHVYGNALYARIVDINNWIRARVQSYRTSYQYYNTEYRHDVYQMQYQWNDNYWKDSYFAKILQRQVQWQTGTATEYSAWSSYTVYNTTGCRDNPPTPPSNTDTSQYTVTGNGLGQNGCSSTKQTYTTRVRTRTAWTYPTYSTKWVNDGYSLASGESFTGSTQLINNGSYYKTSSSSDTGATNPGQHTTPNGAYDQYGGTTMDTRGTYWETTGIRPAPDTYIGSQSVLIDTYWDSNPSGATDTRQVGPYTGYDYYYGHIVLEKCVAGTTTSLDTELLGSASDQTLTLRAAGSNLKVFAGGGLIMDVNEAAHMLTGTKVGIGGGTSDYNPTNPLIDNFSYSILSPRKIRNAAGNGWIDSFFPKTRDPVDVSWLDYDPKRF